ncbi:recombinase family protein [Rhodococcus sp. ACS1]|uniref:recombinase family protein n=1 Tax=Rhodococcus sp. ACS1 TaxID=2028570 RepID=UPI0015CCCBC1|nr:recombinase family protein [Rhodococcus sp. ACS1]
MGGKVSGKLARLPEWDRCFEYLRRGDELVITRLSRPFRSVRHMTELTAQLDERGTDLIVLKQGALTPPRPAVPVPLLFHVIVTMDEMFADLISEGTLEGLESARARGRVGGRAPSMTELQVSRHGRCRSPKPSVPQDHLPQSRTRQPPEKPAAVGPTIPVIES